MLIMSSEVSEGKTGGDSRTEKGEEPIFYHPFQKLCSIGQTSEDVFIILAASASHIFSLNLYSASILGIWPPDGNRHDHSNGLASKDSHERPEDDISPNKRQKLSTGNDGSDSSDSVEIVSERAKGQRRKAKVLTSNLPKVSHLIATTDKKHVVAVTAEDKCIRTFEINQSGGLKPLSERYVEAFYLDSESRR
jgi:tRNA (guanine-N(7)-)-methyltransferase subunit TRM82